MRGVSPSRCCRRARLPCPAPVPATDTADTMGVLLNQTRGQYRLEALQMTADLNALAAERAALYAQGAQYAHHGHDDYFDYDDHYDYEDTLPYHDVEEIVGTGQTASDVLGAWLWHEDAREELLEREWNYLGVGISGDTWVVLLVERRMTLDGAYTPGQAGIATSTTVPVPGTTTAADTAPNRPNHGTTVTTVVTHDTTATRDTSAAGTLVTTATRATVPTGDTRNTATTANTCDTSVTTAAAADSVVISFGKITVTLSQLRQNAYRVVVPVIASGSVREFSVAVDLDNDLDFVSGGVSGGDETGGVYGDGDYALCEGAGGTMTGDIAFLTLALKP